MIILNAIFENIEYIPTPVNINEFLFSKIKENSDIDSLVISHNIAEDGRYKFGIFGYYENNKPHKDFEYCYLKDINNLKFEKMSEFPIPKSRNEFLIYKRGNSDDIRAYCSTQSKRLYFIDSLNDFEYSFDGYNRGLKPLDGYVYCHIKINISE